MKFRSLTPLLLALIAAFSTTGCSKETSSGILGDRELSESTEIFIGSDQYYIKSKSATSHEAEGEMSSPNSRALLEESGFTSSAETIDGATDDATEVLPKKPATNSTSKPKPKPKPIDIEYVLTKAKDISVGVASDSPKPRVQNDDLVFIPASITKVVTTAAALRTLGSSFKFKTKLGFELSPSGQASGLVIASDGDPTIGIASLEPESNPRMKEIALALKSRGVRELVGEVRLVSIDPRLDVTVYAAGIPAEDMRECYGSLASGFNFRGNCALARMNAKTGFKWELPEIAQYISTSVATHAADRTSLALVPLLTADRVLEGFELRGSYVAKAPSVRQLRLPIGNGAGWFAQGLFAAMREQKIIVGKLRVSLARSADDRAIAFAMLAKRGDSVVVTESAPLSEIVEATNKPSDNFLADAIFKAIGSRFSSAKTSLLDGGRAKIKEVTDAWLLADGHSAWSSELTFNEGAGLSAENRATPRGFLALLRRVALEPTFQDLWQSLPIAGVDGTLGSRMKSTPAAGVVRGKTGTLLGSYQLVGYVPKIQGGKTEYVPFVILTSTTGRNRDFVRRFQDALVQKMAETVARGS